MEKIELHKRVKQQFDKQAQNFSNWSVTRNVDYLQAYFDFCMLSSHDTLLDIACGTGEFVVFCAPNIQYAHGIDISEGMIEIAKKQSAIRKLSNVYFQSHVVENTPFENNTFSVVTCKSAFHHFIDYDRIFDEMIRCCRIGGRISIQDIIAYSDDYVNQYFEALEREIDISHHITLTKNTIMDLYDRNEIQKENTFELEVELNFQDYLGHAKQTEEGIGRIEKLLEYGLNDPKISKYYVLKDKDIFFKRKVFLILGVKQTDKSIENSING